ncbi:hypothetical protein N0V84_009170 [Fusarium piperis]|uniref:Aminoglycoside phosphotransferase domain-containing protein n=1 Tax=Fusarium piperis TaxID=1435070 RepID=A0A9W8W6V0_9HYPO|nr:hypothetical protein N0V84_009170 [Fusarium piperis]
MFGGSSRAKLHAYGQAQLLHNDSGKQAFMILDYIKGQKLSERQLLAGSEEHRHQFYSELIDIFAQLRSLEFSAAGSLMPAQPEASDPTPVIVGAFSIPMNELKIQGYLPSPSPSRSAAGFLSQQRQLLRDFFSLPTQSLDRETAELEIFALDSIGKIPIAADHEHNAFVLSHTDLRWSNIMVDHELHITGIIDWEWAATVPASNFTPPPWITASNHYFTEFRSVLESKRGSFAHTQLLSEWDCEYTITQRIAEILRRPHRLVNIFYIFIYPQLHTEPREKVILEYFLCEQKQRELQRLLQSSERYTEYLRENNLFVDDEEEVQRANEWMAQVQAYYDRKKTS